MSKEFSLIDKKFMKRALALAVRAWGLTSPNPMVGAVIVKNGVVISEDYHKKAGEPHAEALTIQKAGSRAKGAALYVTLEPCCHKDKRTPPCTTAIINSGIKKVFVAMLDPNQRVSGKGIDELKRHGIEVAVGILEERARRLNEAYIKHITTKTPFVTMKIAMTLDGKIATPTGQSKWITGEKARRIVHQMRGRVDAILTAVGTVNADNPELTDRRQKASRQPKRIAIDPDLEIPMDYRIFDALSETILVARKFDRNGQRLQVREDKLKTMIDKGIKVIEFEGERVDLKWLMRMLGKMDITSVMIEGGASLNLYALEDGIVDKVAVFISPKIIGGRDSVPAVGGKRYKNLQEAYRLKDTKIRRVGEDFLFEGYIKGEISPPTV
ncbi:MAG: bifunctional diaminohydroxyphosphoribosylaminopyrimidine deaminase/5-amino-6-(5-phosphoribosylamino)uracil reductase RibD [Nitrospirae bacterium]|nr:bifunctional diaminohydroxyphosphoribosylaminopyrimidine deaminase/5-amino-6-(5-phosphoribosylamino)uracil reductase RibD [Nitrospirota bacterium]